MDAGSLASGVNLFVSRSRVGISEIVHERLVEKSRILRNNTDMATDGADCEIFDVFAVEFDAALVTVVVAEHVSEQGGLAAARLANKGRCSSRSAFKADVA